MLPSIVNLRQSTSPMYVDFFGLFVAPVVGKKRFDSLCWQQHLSNFVTISDEALALVIFENNYERWMDMGKNKNWTSSNVRPKYTTGGNAFQTPKASKGNNIFNKKKHNGKRKSEEEINGDEECRYSTCAKYQGWSIEGIKRFNFFDAIKTEQESPQGLIFEEALLQFSIEHKDNLGRKSRKEVIEFETCQHELWNVVQNTDTANAAKDILVPGSDD